ncbi:MAG TPA: helix-turn-helix domain-containing protein [Planctomycetaceae bacterium]|nr:helix-turn-helix domain-containing protein [Planctomycetaceae bacterium]
MSASFLTPPQIAAQLGVKSSKIGKWIDKGELSAVNVAENRSGRPRWKISRESFAAFLAARANRPVAKAPRRRKAALYVQEYFK